MNSDSFKEFIKLKELTVSNYRSFKEPATIEQKPVTLLFGGNSSGKTSLLKLFPYLENAFEAKSWSHNRKISIKDILYQKKENGKLCLEYTVEHAYKTNYTFEGRYEHHAMYNIYLELRLVNAENAIKDYESRYKHIGVSDSFTDESRYNFMEERVIIDEQLLNGDGERTRLVDLSLTRENNEMILEEGRINMYTPLLFASIDFPEIDDYIAQSVLEKVKLFTDHTYTNVRLSEIGYSSLKKSQQVMSQIFESDLQVDNIFSSLLKTHKSVLSIIINDTVGIYSDENTYDYLENIIHLFGDELSFVLEYNLSGFLPVYINGIREVMTNKNNLHDFLGIKDKINIRNEDTILYQTNEYLGNKYLGAGYKVVRKDGLNKELINKLSEYLEENEFTADTLHSTLSDAGFVKRYELYDTITETPVSNSEVGLGIVQVLPIVANMAAHEDALLIIEQPELHLHPAQQSKLAQLMIENHRTHQNRFMIETHSEHFIKTLQLEIAKNASAEEPSLTKDDVQILYCNKSPDHKGSTLRKIELTADGSFAEPWPDNFFDVSADITLERLRLTNRN